MTNDTTYKPTRAQIIRARVEANLCIWVMTERARLAGQLPGPTHYTARELEQWGSEASRRAFRQSELTYGQ